MYDYKKVYSFILKIHNYKEYYSIRIKVLYSSVIYFVRARFVPEAAWVDLQSAWDLVCLHYSTGNTALADIALRVNLP